MIPVELQPEPEDFNDKVRKHGLDWLAAKGIPVSGPLPAGETLPSFWTRALQQLGTAYSQVCSYFAVRIDTVTGDLTTDHFVPKSKHPGVPTTGPTSAWHVCRPTVESVTTTTSLTRSGSGRTRST